MAAMQYLPCGEALRSSTVTAGKTAPRGKAHDARHASPRSTRDPGTMETSHHPTPAERALTAPELGIVHLRVWGTCDSCAARITPGDLISRRAGGYTICLTCATSSAA